MRFYLKKGIVGDLENEFGKISHNCTLEETNSSLNMDSFLETGLAIRVRQ